MKQITNFMSEISDEFKIVVVDAIRTLCLKYPQKQRTLMNFLSTILRDEGGFEYKKTIVNTILVVIKDIPESKEAGLSHLCEFIEDCEFPYLSCKILNILGREGPYTSQPSKYIRYIYNRISLESAAVRASAVSALAKFALKLESLRTSIMVLLQRSLSDNDDEVRSRAAFYLRLLEKDKDSAAKMISTDFPFPIQNVLQSLLEYKKNPSAAPFSIASVPIQPSDIDTAIKPTNAKKGQPQAAASIAAPAAAEVASSRSENPQELYAAMLAGIPQFAKLGPLLRSSKPVELTESETEYVVTCIKHTFPQHFVFQVSFFSSFEWTLN
jgi:coatomer protein complex subunit gamma